MPVLELFPDLACSIDGGPLSSSAHRSVHRLSPPPLRGAAVGRSSAGRSDGAGHIGHRANSFHAPTKGFIPAGNSA